MRRVAGDMRIGQSVGGEIVVELLRQHATAVLLPRGSVLVTPQTGPPSFVVPGEVLDALVAEGRVMRVGDAFVAWWP